MWTYQAERTVGYDRCSVRLAIGEALRARWGSHATVVVLDDDLRVDAIGSEDDPATADVWLTWTFEAVAGATRVRLTLDEVEPGPDATAAVTELLDAVFDTVATVEAPGS
jgi:hypothetical protein